MECFVAADLARIKLCRSVGINTAKFYGMQIQEMFSSLQNIFKDCLEQFFNRVMGDLGAAGKTRRVRSNDVEPDEDYDYMEYVDCVSVLFVDRAHEAWDEARRASRHLL